VPDMAALSALAMVTEDEAALLWGAIQVQIYASVTGEPDQPTIDRLERLDDLGVMMLRDMRGQWGYQTNRRNVDHAYRAMMGTPARCAVANCGLPPDVHTKSAGLSDALRGNMVARREGITRTTTNQPGRVRR
jgi:hypothetical protein